MKRMAIRVVSALLLIMACLLFGLYFWIGHEVRKNIKITQGQYPGAPENALISFLVDENNSASDRTQIAVWTLGQIRSEKALPLLYQYYYIDPDGTSCFGKHDSQLCQYEIQKAIASIEKRRFFSNARLK